MAMPWLGYVTALAFTACRRPSPMLPFGRRRSGPTSRLSETRHGALVLACVGAGSPSRAVQEYVGQTKKAGRLSQKRHADCAGGRGGGGGRGLWAPRCPRLSFWSEPPTGAAPAATPG